MKNYVIITDSCSDLDKSLREKYNIQYIPMHFTVDGKEYDADLDWKDFSVKEFYDLMRNGKRVTTSQITVNEFETVFSNHAKNGEDILYIGCSSALSASVKSAVVAAEHVKEKFPDTKIACIDSLNSSFALGTMAIFASKARSIGKTIEEVADIIENEKLKYNQEATVESLKYLKQSGRISAASAFFGGMLSVKPIIISDVKGRNVAVEKVRGRYKSFEKIAERVANEIILKDENFIFISHADSEADALLLKKAIASKIDAELTFYIGPIGPIVGASTGPGTLIADFYGKEVTFGEN